MRFMTRPLTLLAPLFLILATLPSHAGTPANTSQDAATTPFMADLSNLPRDLATMKAEKIPMLLFVHASYCSYCQVVDSNFIQPMVNDPAYRGKLIVRRLEIDAPLSIIDRQGNKESNMAFARRLGVRLVPVVAMFGPDGQAIGEPLRGVSVPDFYPFYLQKAIELAEHCVKNPDPHKCTPTNKSDQRNL